MSGKIVIIGATGYTGSALARSYVKDNIECHLIARNEEELNKLSAETNFKYSVCSDVTNLQKVEESLKDIENDKISGLAYCVGSIVKVQKKLFK